MKSVNDLNLKQNGLVEIIGFWKGMNERASNLVVDIERSFSIYKYVASNKLSDRSTAMLVGLQC